MAIAPREHQARWPRALTREKAAGSPGKDLARMPRRRLAWPTARAHTGAMFEKKIDAEARILADEGSGSVMNTDFHGVHWSHHTYILEVRPSAEDY